MTRLIPKVALAGLTVLLVGLAALVALRIADGDAPRPEQAREAGKRWLDAIQDGNGDVACSLITERLQAEGMQANRIGLPTDVADCEEFVVMARQNLSELAPMIGNEIPEERNSCAEAGQGEHTASFTFGTRTGPFALSACEQKDGSWRVDRRAVPIVDAH